MQMVAMVGPQQQQQQQQQQVMMVPQGSPGAPPMAPQGQVGACVTVTVCVCLCVAPHVGRSSDTASVGRFSNKSGNDPPPSPPFAKCVERMLACVRYMRA